MESLEPVVEDRLVRIRSRGGKSLRSARTATTELRIGRVEQQPPQRLHQEPAVPLWAVHVQETDAATARRIVGWYESRWSIEEFFRALKSGTRIRDRKLRTDKALAKCLAFDAVCAWRTFDLGRAARETPQAPARRFLSLSEMAAIRAVSEAELILPPAERGRTPPEDIHWWVLRLAGLAGFHPSNRRPLPGNEKMWQAHALMRPMARGIEAYLAVQPSWKPDWVSGPQEQPPPSTRIQPAWSRQVSGRNSQPICAHTDRSQVSPGARGTSTPACALSRERGGHQGLPSSPCPPPPP